MSESNVEEAPAPAAQAASTATEDRHTDEEGRLEHVKSSVKHAVENVVEKVTDTLHPHKGDNAQKP